MIYLVAAAQAAAHVDESPLSVPADRVRYTQRSTPSCGLSGLMCDICQRNQEKLLQKLERLC